VPSRPSATQDEVVQALRCNEIFSQLDDAALDTIASACPIVTFRKGEVFLNQDEPGNACYLIVKGVVRIYRRSPEGRILELARRNPGTLVGEIALFDGLTRTASASAATKLSTLCMSREMLLGILERMPATVRPTINVIGRMVREMAEMPVDLVFRDAKERISRRILVLMDDMGDYADLTHHRRVTQTEIAEMIGGTRQTVNIVLKDLEASGAISISADGIRVVNLELLKKAAG
jgi:CRP/FNR family transcriptional regulator, cyclic AMP receptor protein